MNWISRLGRVLTTATTGAMLWGFSGGCVQDDFWARKADEIANGLIIGVINVLLAGTGIQI